MSECFIAPPPAGRQEPEEIRAEVLFGEEALVFKIKSSTEYQYHMKSCHSSENKWDFCLTSCKYIFQLPSCPRDLAAFAAFVSSFICLLVRVEIRIMPVLVHA